MLKLGVIKQSNSPWASLPVLVTKPDGSKRFCVDYRGLNKVTKVDAMPLPRVDDVLNALQGAKYFTNMDATSGFWQMKMKDSDQEKTAFLTPDGLEKQLTELRAKQAAMEAALAEAKASEAKATAALAAQAQARARGHATGAAARGLCLH